MIFRRRVARCGLCPGSGPRAYRRRAAGYARSSRAAPRRRSRRTPRRHLWLNHVRLQRLRRVLKSKSAVEPLSAVSHWVAAGTTGALETKSSVACHRSWGLMRRSNSIQVVGMPRQPLVALVPTVSAPAPPRPRRLLRRVGRRRADGGWSPPRRHGRPSRAVGRRTAPHCTRSPQPG